MDGAVTVGLSVLVDEGLGNSGYLLDLGDGGALVVDPPRDLRAVRASAAEAGLRVRFVADTHLHADFLSGAAQLAHDEGALVLASAAGDRGFVHRGLVDGEEVDLGGVTLRAMATPGHTDEHLAFLMSDDQSPLGVFSGGSLLVGSVARTDLLGRERREELARAQYGSLRRLVALPEATALWPTHGAGSFCAAPPGTERTSTIGREIASNPLLGLDEDTFVAQLLGSLGSYPPYFRRLGELNRTGPIVLASGYTPALVPLSVSTVRALRSDGALVVDVRPVADYAAGHIPGSVSIPLRPQFATWLGWLVEPGVPLVIVRNTDGTGAQDAAEVVWQALKVGYDNFAGELDVGMDAWAEAGLAVATTELVRPEQLGDRQVLDIRQDTEFAEGHLPAATHIELGELVDGVATAPEWVLPPASEAPVLMCGHGERAASAASLFERAGYRNLAVLVGGPRGWAAATGSRLESGA
ncbi:MBL fold metallo-hydrolase [Pseudonocardia spinosispora]|uniref:MBL fold metallo-hydrolase n=1 Tax=Pseudonocardia spinosispora TaxID=103441 RepID=UPI00041E2149|nr:MBL fold metallo-hydrolase [Pseudonocardia spinosispora]